MPAPSMPRAPCEACGRSTSSGNGGSQRPARTTVERAGEIADGVGERAVEVEEHRLERRTSRVKTLPYASRRKVMM